MRVSLPYRMNEGVDMQAIKLVLYTALALVLSETIIGMTFAGLFGMALVDYIQIKRGNILLA